MYGHSSWCAINTGFKPCNCRETIGVVTTTTVTTSTPPLAPDSATERLLEQAEILAETDMDARMQHILINSLCAKVRELQAERESLVGLLRECTDELDNAASYMGDYFYDKYDMSNTLRRFRHALSAHQPAKEDQ